MPALLTVAEVAEILRVARSWVYEHARELGAVKLGTGQTAPLRIPRDGLQRIVGVPGDPYLQPPNRPLLAPEQELRKRLFRRVASPGAVLSDGRLAALWRSRKGEIAVEELAPLDRAAFEDEARRVAELQAVRSASVGDRRAARSDG